MKFRKSSLKRRTSQFLEAHLKNKQELFCGALSFYCRHHIDGGSGLRTARQRPLHRVLVVGRRLVRHEAGEGLRDDVHDALVVGEAEALEQHLADKLGLGLLRVLAQGLVPVLPAPSELKKGTYLSTRS
jgi:hypothetical protein